MGWILSVDHGQSHRGSASGMKGTERTQQRNDKLSTETRSGRRKGCQNRTNSRDQWPRLGICRGKACATAVRMDWECKRNFGALIHVYQQRVNTSSSMIKTE